MDEVEKMDEFSGSLVQQVIFPPIQRASLGREGLVYNWKQSICKHVQARAVIVLGFSKPRKTYGCIYTNTFTSKLSRGLDKPSPKLLRQDKPRLELAVHRRKTSDWSTRDHVTLPNSKWRQYLHRLFIPVERRLNCSLIWVANAYTDIFRIA